MNTRARNSAPSNERALEWLRNNINDSPIENFESAASTNEVYDWLVTDQSRIWSGSIENVDRDERWSLAEGAGDKSDYYPLPPVSGVLGIDVSAYQTDKTGKVIDWDAVKAAGVQFAFARATIGTGDDSTKFVPSQFARNWKEMGRIGLIRGAYHFFMPQQDPLKQVDNFVKTVGALGVGDLPPMLDVEKAFDHTMSFQERATRVAKWLVAVEAALGRKPIIYTMRGFWGYEGKYKGRPSIFANQMGNPTGVEYEPGRILTFADYLLWIAATGENTSENHDPKTLPRSPGSLPSAWRTWSFWQYYWWGKVNGIGANADLDVDLDVFNGSLTDLKLLAGIKEVVPSGRKIPEGPVESLGDIYNNLAESIDVLASMLKRHAPLKASALQEEGEILNPALGIAESILDYHAYRNSVRWGLTNEGIDIEGSGIERTAGEPVTVRRVWLDYSESIERWASYYNVPAELIIATICTESGGNAAAVREEPGFVSDGTTPDKVSPGLMQTLISTARSVLAMPEIDRQWLLDADNSIRAGTATIAQQKTDTGFDPPKVATAYNAGSLIHQNGIGNRWKMRMYPIGTSEHTDRFVKWFNDFCYLMVGGEVVAATRYFSESPSGEGKSTTSSVKHYTLKSSDVVLSARAEELVSQIADEYFKKTGKGIKITSGARDAGSQADAMYRKLQLGDDLSIYKNKSARDEIKKAYSEGKAAKESEAEIIDDMKAVIENQIGRGIYVSRHLREGAADVSLGGLDQQAFRQAVNAIGIGEPLLEDKPPHFHVRF